MKMERWKINLYTLWVTQVFAQMGFGLSVPFIPYYLQTMGVSGTTQLNFYVGLASTLPAATMAIFAPIWGKVSDIYGRKVMIVRAMVAACILFILMSFSNTVWMFLVLRAIQGVFTGTITASMAFVSANTPQYKMSFALGFMTSSNFLGYAIGPAVGGFLAEAMGYSACFLVGSGIMAAGFLLVIFLVKEDKNSYGARLAVRKDKSDAKPKLFTKFIVATIAVIFVARVSRTMFTPFVALFVQERLGTIVGAATYTGAINSATGIATAVAAVTLTRLGDKYNKLKLVFLMTGASLVAGALLIPGYPIAIFVGVYAIYFFIAGAIEPILTSAASEETDPAIRGSLFGILGTVNSLAMMVSPMIGAGISTKFSVNAILVLIPIGAVLQLIVLYCNKKNFKHTIIPENIKKTPLNDMFEN